MPHVHKTAQKLHHREGKSASVHMFILHSTCKISCAHTMDPVSEVFKGKLKAIEGERESNPKGI